MADQVATLTNMYRADCAHLTPVLAVLLAWLRYDDVQAVRWPDGREDLLVCGRAVPLDPAAELWPSQMVIALAHLPNRRRKAAIDRLERRALSAAYDTPITRP